MVQKPGYIRKGLVDNRWFQSICPIIQRGNVIVVVCGGIIDEYCKSCGQQGSGNLFLLVMLAPAIFGIFRIESGNGYLNEGVRNYNILKIYFGSVDRNQQINLRCVGRNQQN